MDEAGNTKDDLSLPKGTDDAEKLAVQIKDDFDAGKELVVTVLKVLARSALPAGMHACMHACMRGVGSMLKLAQHLTAAAVRAQSMGEEMVNAVKSSSAAAT
jgi:hypothetical protein